jgi:two-component system CheB/CheR fusion protein
MRFRPHIIREEARLRNSAHHEDTPTGGPIDFAVVGLGASAGGLEAFRKLFAAIPADTGMAYILIQHLDPTHESMMVDLLSGHTAMVVAQAAEGMPIEPDHVYVMPPRAYLSVRDGALRLSPLRGRHGTRMPLDVFLRSLADDLGERAICAILSGTGTDGSLGLKAVKEQGGLVIVQDPAEAAYDGMPRSAVATGAADLVLPLAEIPEALAQYGRHTYMRPARKEAAPQQGQTPDTLAQIIELVGAQTSYTFALYKQGTLARRIERRMAIGGIGDLSQYLAILRRSPDEVHRLANDLLINVTSFFRDLEAFEVLAGKVIPELVRREPGRPLRVWVPACSTGEETYSIVMLLIEAIEAAKQTTKLQVFASDLDPDAVATARNGLYPEAIDGTVTPARLARFFSKEGGSYRVRRELRETVVFTVQDLLGDPPFSNIDLVSCRNLLIYLRPEVQEKVLGLFHFALAEHGILFLGTAETVGGLEHRFAAISKKHRVYRRVGRSRPGEVSFPIGARGSARAASPQAAKPAAGQRTSLGALSQQLLLETYAPASVLINRKHEGLYFFGPTDRYLRVATGDASRDLLAMAREGLRGKVRAAIRQSGAAGAVASEPSLTEAGNPVDVGISVQPMRSDGEDFLLVSFIDKPRRESKAGAPDESAADTTRIAQLEHELDITRQELQSAIRDLEASNEELKAINEEATSVNEEFQSTNEELETSKEELQSLNDELTALNTQLHETVELHRATSADLQNILTSSDVVTLFLDRDLKIRFFTPAAKSLFSVIGSDIGRPLSNLTHRFPEADLLADARTVLASVAPLRREIEAEDGRSYIERVLPYRGPDERIEGVVFTFADISEVKAADREIRSARAYSDSILETIRQPLLVLDADLRVISASRSFYRDFAVSPEETLGREVTSAADHRLDVPALREFLELIRADDAAIEDYELEITLPPLGLRSLLLNARKIDQAAPLRRQTLVAIDDVTDRKRVETALGTAKRTAERANLGKSRFLAAASHDLRQPLQTLSLLHGILAKKIREPDTLKLVDKLDETLGAMSGMLNTLLDINQLEAGVVHPDIFDFPINDLLDRLNTEFAYQMRANGLEWRVLPSRLTVRSDPKLLEQMIRNLLSNAIKYTKRGKILLGCRRRGDKLRIEVADTGIGIPGGQLGAIFEEFNQLENPARERSRGLGLGLTIVQRVGALLDHGVEVRSRPALGSIFTVEVPVVRGVPEGLPRAAEAVAPRPNRNEAILIVEDDPTMRSMLELLFGGEGYRTHATADGPEALALVAKGKARPDIVIADYNLPGGLTGLQVVAGVRQTLHRDIPVVILTGDISTRTLREIARNDCVQRNKPVKAEELTHLIDSLLARTAPASPQAASRETAARGNGGERPTVFVVDDDEELRAALRGLLEQEGRRVEVYATAWEFLDSYSPGRSGCLIVDWRMPDMNGMELLDRLKAERRELPTIMITGYADVPLAVRAMKAGAASFIEKPVRAEELIAAVDRALKQAGGGVELALLREAAAKRVASLTPRQRQVMNLVIEGNRNKEIAAVLGASQRTIENHRAAVMKKVGARSLSQLIHLTLEAAQHDRE